MSARPTRKTERMERAAELQAKMTEIAYMWQWAIANSPDAAKTLEILYADLGGELRGLMYQGDG